MEEKELDIKAVHNSLALTAKEAIVGIFGDENEQVSVNKMHNMIDMADKLNVKDLEITVSLKDLRRAKKKYEETEKEEEIE